MALELGDDLQGVIAVDRFGRGDRSEQQRGIAHGARQRPGGILRSGDRDDAVAADQTDGGFQADQGGHGRRADDAPVGLGADADGGKSRGDRAAGARAGAAGRSIQRVGIARLPAARTPAGAGAGRTEIRPLAQVGLAEDHRPGLTQAAHQRRVGLWAALLFGVFYFSETFWLF